MRVPYRCTIAALAVVLSLSACGLLPLAGSPAPSTTDGPSVVPTGVAESPIASTTPSPATTAPSATMGTPGATSSPEVDPAMGGWFEWLWPADSDTATLYAGRLDGRAFEVIDSGRPIDARASLTGPAAGMVVTSWVDDADRVSIDLIDTGDGSRTTIADSEDANLGAIDPSGEYVYWNTANSERILGVWRRAVSGGPVEEVLAGKDVAGPYINFSLDGRYVVFSGRRPGETGGWDYSIFDANFEPVGELLDGPYGQPIGFWDNRLLVYPPGTDDLPPTVSLFALDIDDWSAEEVVSLDVESRAAILPGADATPQLIFEGHDDEDRYTLNVLDADGSPRVLFVGDAPWDDPPISMVYSPTSHLVEADGWVPVFPQGQALTATDRADEPRRLVRISDGEAMVLPAITVQP